MSNEIYKAIEKLVGALGDVGECISSTDKRKTLSREVRDDMYNICIERDNKYFDSIVIDDIDTDIMLDRARVGKEY